MEAFELAVTITLAIVTLMTGVSTAVWAIAQINATTEKLGAEIRHLAKEIANITEGHSDHEQRLRQIERISRKMIDE